MSYANSIIENSRISQSQIKHEEKDEAVEQPVMALK